METNNRLLFIIYEVDFIDNIGIAYISAIARQAGWLPYLTVFNKNSIDAVIKKNMPRIICYSSMSGDSHVYYKINAYLKSRYQFTSIMGGPHATFFPEAINDSGIDFFCIGEGEQAFYEFLSNLKNEKPLDEVENFQTETLKNPVRPLICDLDSLPLPDRRLVFDNTELKDMPIKMFMASRGCPFPCSYCYNNSLKTMYKGKGTYVRQFSVDRVLEEIKQVRAEYPLEFIKFEDDLFGINKKWLEAFSEKYRKEIDIPFNCLLRIDFLDAEKVRLLKNAKCVSVTIAIDSSNDYLRNDILNRNMKISNDEITRRIDLIKKSGIRVMTNSIIGIPYSTIQDELLGIDLNIRSRVDYANATILVPYPKTRIWDRSIKEGLLPEDIDSGHLVSIQKESIFTGFNEKEKDIQWNLMAFYPAIVRMPALKDFLVRISTSIKPNFLFSLFYIVVKSVLMKKYIYPVRLSFGYKFKLFVKALKIETKRMFGKISSVI